MTTTADLVAALGDAIAERIGEPRYRLWFVGNTKLSWDGSTLTVGVPNRFYQEWLQNTFTPAVQEAAQSILDGQAAVSFVIDPVLFQAKRSQEATLGAEAVSATVSPPRTGPRQPDRRWRQLDDFVVGPCNRLAHAAAVNLVEAPADAANPLTLHGPAGVGKTHLLEGIYAGLCAGLSEAHVLFVTAEDFTNRFLQAMRANGLGGFRQRFRGAAALVVDDLHFLANKQATQAEFLHTFETLRNLGRPVAVTCDAHPRLLGALLPELSDRLLGGGVWAIAPLDHGTRASLLRAKATRLGLTLPDEAVQFLADGLNGNVRELEGALTAIHHYRLVNRRPVTLALVHEAVGDLIRHTQRAIQLADIERAIHHVLGLDRKVLHTPDRTRSASYSRMWAMYLARKHTGSSFGEIGRYFGGRNHSTVIAAQKKVRAWLEGDESLRIGDRRWGAKELLQKLEEELRR